MPLIVGESNRAHLGIAGASTLAIGGGRLEILAPDESSSPIEFQPKTR
jgi:hypothetical protein